MKILGFNFTKISAEIISKRPDDLKLSTNIDVSEIGNAKADFLKSDEKILAIKFSNTVDYSPNYAKIILEGNLILSTTEDQSKEVLEEWKDKKMPEDFKISIFNIILRRSTLKALQLEEELNLPTHIPLPSVKSPQKTEEAEKNSE